MRYPPSSEKLPKRRAEIWVRTPGRAATLGTYMPDY